jgi:RND family efflux transporter MFP subunit
VTLVRPSRQTLHRTIEQPGAIEAFEQTPIYAKIAGYVLKVHVDIGDRVRKDDLLAQLWVPEMVEELKRKESLIGQAQAAIEQARKILAAAEANIKSAQALVREARSARRQAQAEYERYQSQFSRFEQAAKKGVIESDALDESRFRRAAAQAALDVVEAKINSAEALEIESEAKRDKAQADVHVALALLKVAQADRDQMKATLDYANLSAPFDGVVTRRSVDTRHFVQPAAASSGESLFVVAQMDPVRIFVDVPEADASLVSDGALAVVRVQALQGQEFAGKVTRSSWSLDPKARTLRTEIDLPNPQGRLRPGMYANATIRIENPNALTLPASALVTQGEQTFCFRVEGGKAIRTPIRIGMRSGKVVEVIRKQSGAAKPGEENRWEDWTGEEEIVAADAASLRDGQEVIVSRNP